MAVLRMNVQNLHVDVLVGVEETYKPTKEIKQFLKDVKKLKTDAKRFLEKNWKTLEAEQIENIFKHHPEEKKKWDKYMEDTYVPGYKDLNKKLHEINKKLCSNYSEIIKE